MTVRPVSFNADGSIDVIDDDVSNGPHTGTIRPAAIAAASFAATPLGTPDHRFIALACPTAGCASVTQHPIGGGGAPAMVQELFVRVLQRVACPCGKLPLGRPVPIIQSHVKLEAERMDGVGRWAAGVLH